MPSTPQSVFVRHSTQACVAVSQIGRPCVQLAFVVHIPPQVWPLEHAGLVEGQSALVTHSTQV